MGSGNCSAHSFLAALPLARKFHSLCGQMSILAKDSKGSFSDLQSSLCSSSVCSLLYSAHSCLCLSQQQYLPPSVSKPPASFGFSFPPQQPGNCHSAVTWDRYGVYPLFPSLKCHSPIFWKSPSISSFMGRREVLQCLFLKFFLSN
jgi:hypothetical protein